MNFEDLSDELKAKAKACNTPEELLALAKQEGYELSDDELDAVSGGHGWTTKEINGEAVHRGDCEKLHCNTYWCREVYCPEFTCNGYNQ